MRPIDLLLQGARSVRAAGLRAVPSRVLRAFFFGEAGGHGASLFFLPFAAHANGFEFFAGVRNA